MMFPVVAALLAGLVTTSGYLSSLAALDTSQVMTGELWRLLTGHLAHLSWRQYLVDAAAFIALYGSYGRRAGTVSAMVLALFAALSVSLAVIVADVHQVYGGLSGLSCAAVAALLADMILARPRQVVPYLLCAMFCCYLLFMEGSAGGVEVAREAHLAGVASGTIFALMRRRGQAEQGRRSLSPAAT